MRRADEGVLLPHLPELLNSRVFVQRPHIPISATLTNSLRLSPRARFGMSRGYGRGVTMGPYPFLGLLVLVVQDSARESVGVWVRYSYPPPDVAPTALTTVSGGSTALKITGRCC